jgi:Eukaryotic rRNA processing protein EBP2
MAYNCWLQALLEHCACPAHMILLRHISSYCTSLPDLTVLSLYHSVLLIMLSHNIREVAFYNNALAAVKQSKLLLKQQSIPYKRPPDFLCEMVKSDSHMAKVRVDSRLHLYSVILVNYVGA